jgi:lipid-A-disaccharide synthase
MVYYISPQVWAWKENRVKKMKQCIDKMLCILPFEKEYYKDRWNWEVEYVGHPLVEVVEASLKSGRSLESWTHGLHGHSRLQAYRPPPRQPQTGDLKKTSHHAGGCKIFSWIMNLLWQKHRDWKILFMSLFLQPTKMFQAFANRTYDLLAKAKAALVTSGTATLETALFGVPEVVCYKGSNISYQIAKRLIKIKYISLVNLIMDKPVVKELIQHELTTPNLVIGTCLLLTDEKRKAELQKDYTALKELLSAGGTCF